MSTLLTEVPGTGYATAQIDQFIAEGQAAADAALGPARKLFDASRGRAIAVELQAAFIEAVLLFRNLVAAKLQIQRDNTTKPDLLRAKWQETAKTYEDSVRPLRAQITTQMDELNTALEAEAIPVSDDPAAILVARQEVELALKTADGHVVQTMQKLAARGGDIAATVASEWGRMTLKAAAGDDTNHDLIRAEAIRTALTGEDEGRRRAAAALQALTDPQPGGRGGALYEANVKLAVFLLDVGSRVASTLPIIP